MWWALFLLALLGAVVPAASPAPPAPAHPPAGPGHPPSAPEAFPEADPVAPASPPPPDPIADVEERRPAGGPLPDGPGTAACWRLLEPVFPLWEIYRAAAAVDDEFLQLARKLEAGELSFWVFALAARRTAARHEDYRREFSELARGVPAEAAAFAGAAADSLEHRARAARLAERAAFTLSENYYAQALEEHRQAVVKGVGATVHLMVLCNRHGIPWPPPDGPR